MTLERLWCYKPLSQELFTWGHHVTALRTDSSYKSLIRNESLSKVAFYSYPSPGAIPDAPLPHRGVLYVVAKIKFPRYSLWKNLIEIHRMSWYSLGLELQKMVLLLCGLISSATWACPLSPLVPTYTLFPYPWELLAISQCSQVHTAQNVCLCLRV